MYVHVQLIFYQTMFEALLKYINSYISKPISESEFEGIKKAFIPKKIRKRQYLLKQGDVCKTFAFITKGAIRQYMVDEKGIEHTVQLGIENWWVGDRESWSTLSPSIYNIEAWEDSELLLINREDGMKLVRQFPAFNEMITQLDERHMIATQKRITSSISFTAEKRYTEFVSCHPDFLQRFPLHMIASYLGITKDTLSRVRNQTIKK